MQEEAVIAITADVVIRFETFEASLSSDLVSQEDVIYSSFNHFLSACPSKKLHIICERLNLTKPVNIDVDVNGAKEVWNLLGDISKTPEEVRTVPRSNRSAEHGDDYRPDGTSHRGRNVKYEDSMVITVKVADNPKKGTAKARFALYKSGMTVGEYITAGGKRPDISWDAKQGWIEVGKDVAIGDGGSSI